MVIGAHVMLISGHNVGHCSEQRTSWDGHIIRSLSCSANGMCSMTSAGRAALFGNQEVVAVFTF